jgi:hypothetical protein
MNGLEKKTKRRFILIAVLATLSGAGIVLAANAHFVGQVKATLNDDGSVQVCWKEAGLGNNQNIDYTASADGTATYVCVNNGGQCPDASNKITVSGPVTVQEHLIPAKTARLHNVLTYSRRTREASPAPQGKR